MRSLGNRGEPGSESGHGLEERRAALSGSTSYQRDNEVVVGCGGCKSRDEVAQYLGAGISITNSASGVEGVVEQFWREEGSEGAECLGSGVCFVNGTNGIEGLVEYADLFVRREEGSEGA